MIYVLWSRFARTHTHFCDHFEIDLYKLLHASSVRIFHICSLRFLCWYIMLRKWERKTVIEITDSRCIWSAKLEYMPCVFLFSKVKSLLLGHQEGECTRDIEREWFNREEREKLERLIEVFFASMRTWERKRRRAREKEGEGEGESIMRDKKGNGQ